MASTAPIPITRRDFPARRLVTSALAAAGLLIADLVAAETLVSDRFSRLLLVFAAVIGIAAVFRFRFLATCVIFAVADSVFYNHYFDITVGGQKFQPYEAIVAALLILSIVRPKRNTWGGVTGAGVLLFVVFLTISGLLAISSHATTLSGTFSVARDFCMLVLFYPIIRLFPDRRTIEKLITVGIVIAAVSGVLGVMAALGSGFLQSLQDPTGTTYHSAEGLGQILRVRFPGVDLAFGLFWACVVLLIMRRGRWYLWLAALAGMAANVIVSFNRTMWISLLATSIVMLITSTHRIRHRIVGGLVAVPIAILVMVIVGTHISHQSPVYPIIQRATSVLHPNQLAQNSTVTDRATETRIAWRTEQHHLLFGVGANAPFGVMTTVGSSTSNDPFSNTSNLQPQLFVHNQYLYLLLVSGIPGALGFLLAIVSSILRVWRAPSRDPLANACAAGLLAILLASVTEITFSTSDWGAVIALLMGAAYVLSRPPPVHALLRPLRGTAPLRTAPAYAAARG